MEEKTLYKKQKSLRPSQLNSDAETPSLLLKNQYWTCTLQTWAQDWKVVLCHSGPRGPHPQSRRRRGTRASALGFLGVHMPRAAQDPAPGSALLTLPITLRSTGGSAEHRGCGGLGNGAVTPGRKEEAPAERGTEVLKGNGK